jgi:hypothetical protein
MWMVRVEAYGSGLPSPTFRYLHPVPRYTLGVYTTLAHEVANANICDRLDPDHLPTYGWSGNRGTVENLLTGVNRFGHGLTIRLSCGHSGISSGEPPASACG